MNAYWHGSQIIRTIVVSKAYFYYVTDLKKKKRKAYRHVCAHEPLLWRCFDVVAMRECQLLSRTVRFNVLHISKESSGKKSFKILGHF